MNKKEYLDLIIKALDKGWQPKDPLFVAKLESLPTQLFNEALAKTEFFKKNSK